jgi:hypothetical protein
VDSHEIPAFLPYSRKSDCPVRGFGAVRLHQQSAGLAAMHDDIWSGVMLTMLLALSYVAYQNAVATNQCFLFPF